MQYDLIIPDRNDVEDRFDATLITLPWKRNGNTFFNYCKYSCAVYKTVKNNRYDFLIVLTTQNAVFMSGWLSQYYGKRYIVDVRDYTNEAVKPYYWLEQRAIKNAALTVLSSKVFKRFLPNVGEYAVCHNMSEKAARQNSFRKQDNGVIKISYIGRPGYAKQCESMMLLVFHDSRFSFHMYGTGGPDDRELRDFIEGLACSRIVFHGAYTREEKNRLIEASDILFNAYGNGLMYLDTALSNRIYDSLLYKKPIIVSPSTYMQEVAGPIGFAVDFSETKELHALYAWYESLDAIAFDRYANEVLRAIIDENNSTMELVKKVIMHNDET